MEKFKVFFSVVVGTACAAAHAQSQVQFYGISDAYVGNVKVGQRSTTVLNDGGNAASRLGFRGVEDLGGSNKAVFTLEMGANLDNGTSAAGGLFGRQAFVGMEGAFGKVYLGRQYTPMFYALNSTEPFKTNVVFSPIQLSASNDGQGTGYVPLAFRQNNMLRYMAPTVGNISGTIAWAPGEDTNSSGNFFGGGLTYATQSVHLAYTFQRLNSSGTSAGAITNPTNTKHHAITAQYIGDDWSINGLYIWNRSSAFGVRDAKNLGIGFTYRLTPSTMLLGETVRREVDAVNRDAQATNIGVDYSLSKTTMLYSRLFYLQNKGSASNSLGGGTVPVNSGSDVRTYLVGVRHNF